MDYDGDVESDLHRFHGVWVDIDQDEFGGLSAERFFQLAERLAAYEGAVAARIHLLQQEAKTHNPSRATLEQGATQTDNVHALAMQHGDVVEVTQV